MKTATNPCADPPVLLLKPTIISFRGERGAGKSTAARYLEEQYVNVRRLAFADELKVELYDLLSPFTREDISISNAILQDYRFRTRITAALPNPGYNFDFTRRDKINWIDKHKVELRPLIQFYGTEYRRGLDPDYWVKKYASTATAFMESGCVVVCDDARFDNERAYIRSQEGSREFFIIRPGYEYPEDGIPGHASEALARPDEGTDFILANQPKIEAFRKVVTNAVRYLI